ncbi:hypothetical protein HYU22_05010 [Candidatus Woesearchaeota archaeon]|nr:hypothetical protein [Candidatus Woesearchaeota archaeon]
MNYSVPAPAPEHYISPREKPNPPSDQESTILPKYVLSHSYHDRFQQERRDLSKFFPFRLVETFPRQGNERLLGYTYRLDGKIHKQEGMSAEKDLLTTIHETIHTECEYETRVLAEWILNSMFPAEEKYRMRPPEYKW